MEPEYPMQSEEMPRNLEVAGRITQAREAAGLSKAELARKVGVSRASPTNWEKGQEITKENLRKVARACHVSAEWLEYGGSPTEGIDRQFLSMCFQAVLEAQERTGKTLSPEKQAELAAYLYDEYIKERRITQNQVLKLLDLLS